MPVMLGRCSYTAQNECQLKVLGVDDEVAWGEICEIYLGNNVKRKAKLFRYSAHFSPKLLPHLSCHILFLQLSQVSLELANSRNARWVFHFSLQFTRHAVALCPLLSLVSLSVLAGEWEGGVESVDLFSHTHFATLLLSLLSSLGSTFCPAQIPESASPGTPHTPPPFTHPLSQHSVSFPAKFSLYTLFFSCTFLFRVRTKFNTLVVTCVARFFTYF